jgi:inosose dehydratase
MVATLASVAAAAASRLHERLAAGPISWGVCEVPGWGVQLPPEMVLSQMRALGLRATELGPTGYLGSSREEIVRLLSRYELAAVGGFVPVVLHDRAATRDSIASARETATLYAACGAGFLVSAVVVDDAWSQRVPLAPRAWRRLADGLARLDDLAAAAGLEHVLHPHFDTLVQTREDVERVLELSEVALCLDTGHLVLGEVDPVRLAHGAPARIRHAHLKDVDGRVARQLRDGRISFVQAVRAGLFRPLGAGDAPIAETVAALEAAGYAGWFVLEQDTALASADAPPRGGPAEEVRRSIDYLRTVMRTARMTTAKEGAE